MARNLRARKNGIGEPSSKYGYDRDGSHFIADIEENNRRAEENYQAFVEFMKSRDVDPRQFRYMFTRYYDEFIKEVTL